MMNNETYIRYGRGASGLWAARAFMRAQIGAIRVRIGRFWTLESSD
ncbi:MAG: hypothetical protein JJ916_02140 [Phycisphaerales bacterium]|nr:hypothetical protein [Phycisphaerales bacterium]